jgi:glycosyltransferase involved in cell wall biosynthesis
MLREHTGVAPVLTIYNGVPVPAAIRKKRSRFVVGSIGHVSRTKGTDVFLRAAEVALERRPRLAFEHVGPIGLWGDDEFDRNVEFLARSPSLRGRVALLGRGRGEEALRRWSVFVLPSRQDAFPLTTLEAMAAGIPVIATEVGGIPEQVVDGESGILVPPEDASAVAAWIVRLYDDPELRSRLGEAGRAWVSERFTLDAQAEKLHAAYLQTMRRRATRASRSRPARPLRPVSARSSTPSEPMRASRRA